MLLSATLMAMDLTISARVWRRQVSTALLEGRPVCVWLEERVSVSRVFWLLARAYFTVTVVVKEEMESSVTVMSRSDPVSM